MTDYFKAIFKTDIDRNLNFTEETIEILDNKISIYDSKNKILEIDNVEKLDIEYGISICKLIEKIRKIDVEGETISLNAFIGNKELEIKILSPENILSIEDKILFIDENNNLYQIILKDLDKMSLKELNKII